MKNMFKKSYNVLLFVILCLSVMMGSLYSCPTFDYQNPHTITSSAESEKVENVNSVSSFQASNTASSSSSEFFSYLTFTSQDMVYGTENFTADEYTTSLLPHPTSNNYSYVGALYANTNITVHIDESANDISIVPYRKYTTFNSDGNCYNYIDLQQNKNYILDYSTYKVIPIDRDNPLIICFSVSFSYKVPRYTKEGELYYATQYKYYYFDVIQTSQNYSINSPVSYTYTPTGGSSTTVPTLKTGENYKTSKIDLKLLQNGTHINPVYIHFIKNGESYIIYNIDGVFYNDLSRSDTSTSRVTQNSTTNIQNNTLPFDKSGIYEIEIYDRAYSYISKNASDEKNPNANMKYDSFILSADSNAPYIAAISSSGVQIANQQPTNEDVSVYVYNLSSSYVREIELKRYDVTTNKTDSVTYKIFSFNEDQPVDNYNVQFVTNETYNAKILLDKDFVYTLTIKYSDTINAAANKEYKYVIPVVKDIRSQYTTNDTNEQYTATGSNIIQDTIINQDVTLVYDEDLAIVSEYTHSYTVRLANSNPSINGIGSNETIDGAVTLTLNGVGKLTVKINGVTQNQEYENGSTLILSAAGNYTVEIIDEMNSHVSKSFKLGVSMNLATIFLIVIAALLVAGVIFFIVRNRSKMSVK